MPVAAVILPHQLFARHPALKRDRPVYLVEDPWFFWDPHRQLTLHRQKLSFHRATLQAYRRFLLDSGYEVRYLEFCPGAPKAFLCQRLQADGIDAAVLCDPVDLELKRRLSQQAEAAAVRLEVLPTPGFLTSEAELWEYFQGQGKWRQTSFYLWQRRRLQLLLRDGKPLGGRWTFDTLNRRRLPRGLTIPPLPGPDNEPWADEAREYVTRLFPEHPGAAGPLPYPVTHAAARHWLKDFLSQRLPYFGDYQDAISTQEPYLFHSLLSPLLNVGLLTPQEVLTAALDYAREEPVPLNSLEGFLRQLVGWREYVRGVYLVAGDRQRQANFWGHTQPLPPAFYTGTTGLPPVDTVIRRLLTTAYAHHIERLMILGNIMLLLELDPAAVYRWFMEMFIDAYDWVMVPNIFGMSQFADGGLMMTKPYLSSSRYLLKMSDYPAGPWCEVWDGLYWGFLAKHRHYFATQPRLRPLVSVAERLPAARRAKLLRAAAVFKAQLGQPIGDFSG